MMKITIWKTILVLVVLYCIYTSGTLILKEIASDVYYWFENLGYAFGAILPSALTIFIYWKVLKKVEEISRYQENN